MLAMSDPSPQDSRQGQATNLAFQSQVSGCYDTMDHEGWIGQGVSAHAGRIADCNCSAMQEGWSRALSSESNSPSRGHGSTKGGWLGRRSTLSWTCKYDRNLCGTR